jgi:hypothetical protein
MSDLDADACVEVVTEILHEEGEWVYRLFWDSGGPGAGAEYEKIYKFRDRYWPHSSVEGFSGPFDSLEEALTGDFLAITDATVSIECRELSAAELAKRVVIYSAEPGHSVKINGEAWRVSEDKTLERIQAGGRGPER